MSTVDQLNLTKKRLQNLRRKNFGLQQLAVREISNQLTFYRTHPDELEKLKNLPGVLRDKILQVVMKKECLYKQGQKVDFENLKEIFPLLLSARTRYIELNGILSFCPDWNKDRKIEKLTEWCVELLKQIETRAPQVETLVIKRNNPLYTGDDSPILKCADFNQDMVQSLMKMQKLNRLTVGRLFKFNITDLLKICRNVTRLQYIYVGLIYHKGKNKPDTEKVTSSFCNLKELIFVYAFHHDWLGTLCTRNLPNIEVVEYDPNKIMGWIDSQPYGNRHHGLDFSGASNLRSICVNRKDKAKEVDAMPTLFPKVTCLMVRNAMDSSLAENVMPKFDNIRQLHLLNPNGSQIAEKYLNTYGQKMQSLYLAIEARNSLRIDLDLIFKFCPKLEKLSLLNVFLQTQSSKMEYFAELKEIEFNFWYFRGMANPESMIFSNILSAPKLEKVKLESCFFNQNDLWKLNSLIEEKRILKNLHTLHVYFDSSIPEALANVLKSACAFLPKLTDFKFGHCFQCLDPACFRDTVWEMNGVFETEN